MLSRFSVDGHMSALICASDRSSSIAFLWFPLSRWPSPCLGSIRRRRAAVSGHARKASRLLRLIHPDVCPPQPSPGMPRILQRKPGTDLLCRGHHGFCGRDPEIGRLTSRRRRELCLRVTEMGLDLGLGRRLARFRPFGLPATSYRSTPRSSARMAATFIAVAVA